MVTVKIEKHELSEISGMARQRHDAKDRSFRNTGILIPNPSSVYDPHTIGLLGEFAWGKHTNQSIDKKIYKVRDAGEDFADTEIKTITYAGHGEPELKIKKEEFISKKPKLYVLLRVNKKDLTKVQLLGTISREDFCSKKKEKRYGDRNPLNYVVKLSDMDPIKPQNFTEDFKPYAGCVPPGVLLPKIKIDKRHYLTLGVSEDISNYDFLRALCRRGVQQKEINKLPNKDEYYNRVKTELTVLSDLGFIDYILLNWDILNYCHENDIPTGPGRGSAAGSLVLFLIGVTEIDPVKYGLFFERFVSASRAKKIVKNRVTYLDGSLLADIDNDISYEKRQEVISYIEKKHPARTAKILTLNKLSSKLCIRECGKIVGALSEEDVKEVSSLISKKYGITLPLRECYDADEAFKEWCDKNPHIYRIALKIENLNKNTGVHPSGIAISNKKTELICPLQLTNEGDVVTGYDMHRVSELMVKFDVLGLRTLSVIHNTCADLGLNPSEIDVEDPEIYELLSQNVDRPHGLFQIEAETDHRVCKKILPKNLEELSAVLAIARPGALDFLEDYYRYSSSGEFQTLHPFFDDILEPTGGIPLYQEQLMQMAVKVGFTLDEAEQIRRIVGKKKVSEMPKWKNKIDEKIREMELDERIGEILWRVAEDSANYSFNKSHSLAYSKICATTAYLKFKHTKHFFVSLLKMSEFEPNPQEEIDIISRELKNFGIKLLAPNLYKSEMVFSIEDSAIRYGLGSIKGVSTKSLESLRKFRRSKNENKYEIFSIAKQSGINIGILSALIQAGAISESRDNRSKLVLEAQLFNLLTDREKRNCIIRGEEYKYDLITFIKDCLSENLIADDGRPIMKASRYETIKKKYDPYLKIYNLNKKSEKFANWFFEKSLLGYSYSHKLRDVFSGTYAQLKDSAYFNTMPPRSRKCFIGSVGEVFQGKSRNGNNYIKFSLQDDVGSFNVLLMDNRNQRRLSQHIEAGLPLPVKDGIAVVKGARGDDILFADSVKMVDEKIYMKLQEVR